MVTTTIFLDESGDLGFDFTNSRTSRYLIIGALVCQDATITNTIKQSVKRTIRNKLANNEFKGVHTTIAIKRYFLNQIILQDKWYLYFIIADKTTWRKKFPTSKFTANVFYDALVKELLMQIKFTEQLSSLSLILDKSKSDKNIREFNPQIRDIFNNRLSRNTPFTIEHLSSQTDHGLQAIDNFCWGMGRLWEKGDREWYNDFKEKLIMEQLLK